MNLELSHLIIGVLVLSNLLTLAMLLRHKGALSTLPSFDTYVTRHGMPREQGSTRCYKGGKGLNMHSCRHCGTRLYRS